MEQKIVVSRAAEVGKVCRNGRLITRDDWEMGLYFYRKSHGDIQIPVTLGCDLYASDYISIGQRFRQIDLSTVIGNVTKCDLSTIEIYIKSMDKFNMVKDLVENHNYVAGLRYTAKPEFKNLTEREKEFYQTDMDSVNKLRDINIIAFDLIPYDL